MMNDPIFQLFPPNLSKVEKGLIYAIRQEILALPQHVKRSLWNPDTCPLEFLPYLAWSVGLEEWNNNWPENVKRKQVREAIMIAKKRGTLWAVKQVLQNLGVSTMLTPWHGQDPLGDPYTFKVSIVINENTAEGVNNAELLNDIKHGIERTKSLRDHYTITQGVKIRGRIGLIGILRTMNRSRMKFQTDKQPLVFKGSLGITAFGRGIVYNRFKMTL